MNLPNFISFLRICSVPIIVWLIYDGAMMIAFWLTVAAAISDAVDGIIAKKFNQVTVLGAFLDPIADKALLVGLFVVLGQEGYIAMWLVILVVFRDVLIVGGALIFHTITHSLKMAPLMISKVNTVAQLVLLVGTLGVEGYEIDVDGVRNILALVVALTTIWSGTAYVYLWSQKATEFEKEDIHDSHRGEQ